MKLSQHTKVPAHRGMGLLEAVLIFLSHGSSLNRRGMCSHLSTELPALSPGAPGMPLSLGMKRGRASTGSLRPPQLPRRGLLHSSKPLHWGSSLEPPRTPPCSPVKPFCVALDLSWDLTGPSLGLVWFSLTAFSRRLFHTAHLVARNFLFPACVDSLPISIPCSCANPGHQFSANLRVCTDSTQYFSLTAPNRTKVLFSCLEAPQSPDYPSYFTFTCSSLNYFLRVLTLLQRVLLTSSR